VIEDFDKLDYYVEPSDGEATRDETGRKIIVPVNWWWDDIPDESIPDRVKDVRATDMTTISKAMSERWPITPEKRQEMIELAQEVMKFAKSPRTKLAAMKVLLMADALNVRGDSGPGGNHLHLHGEGPKQDPKEVAKQLMMDPKYISFLRQLDGNEPEANDGSVDFKELQEAVREESEDLSALEGTTAKRRDEANPIPTKQEGPEGTSGPVGR